MSNTNISSNRYEDRRRVNNRIRRRRELIQHITITVLSVCLIIAMALIFGSLKSEASGKPEDRLYKSFTAVEVSYGDSLYSLAREYVCEDMNDIESFINEVIYINNINDDKIYAGSTLIIPVFRKAQ